MFWNLVRYEFKNVNKWYLALYGAVLAISVLISMSITSISHTYNSYSNNSPYLLVLLLLAFGGLSVTLWIATIFLIIRRFKGSVYDRQGYLTLTLPVSEHQIISAKLLGGLIWSILSYIVFILSVLIIFSLTPVVKEIPTLYRLMSPYLGYGWLYGLSLLTGSVTWILSIYLSISIGQLFNEYRTALAVLAYIVISIVVSYIGFFLKVDDQINTLMIVGILKNILLGTIYYLGTYYILKNKGWVFYTLTQYQAGYDGAYKYVENTSDTDSQATHGSCYRAVSKGCSCSDCMTCSTEGKTNCHWIVNFQPLQKGWSDHTG